MAEKGPKDTRGSAALPQTYPSDLVGRQSVRATFRLSEKAIHAISVIAVQLGIKQKSVLDHLLEDMDALSSVARQIRAGKPEQRERIQKTYVVSRRTLSVLERTAMDFDATRDSLLEQSVKRLLPLIAEERERHLNRKQVLRELDAYLAEGEALRDKCRELLGDADPVYRLLSSGLKGVAAARDQAQVLVERGRAIERY